MEFMAPPTQPMGLHVESGKYGRDVDVRVVAQYVGHLQKNKDEAGKHKEDVQQSTNMPKGSPPTYLTQRMPDPGDTQANARSSAANEKAVTLGSLQAPPPKSTNGGETKKHSLLRPKTHQVRSNAKMAPPEVWDDHIISTLQNMIDNAKRAKEILRTQNDPDASL